MRFAVSRLGPIFCGEIDGVDPASLDDPATAAIKEAWLAHQVVVFHGPQPLT